MKNVIDTNMLRSPDLEAAMRNSAPRDEFLITDTTLLETMKMGAWEDVSKRNFAIIAKYDSKVLLTEAVADLMKNEIATGKPTAEIIERARTPAFRQFLQEIAQGKGGQNLDYVRQEIAGAHASLTQHQQNHARNLQGSQEECDAISNNINLDSYQALKDPAERRTLRLFFAKTNAIKSIEALLNEEGCSEETVESLVTDSCLLRFRIGLYLKGFYRALARGKDGLTPEEITNEMMDLDQAVIGTYCDNILTFEKTVKELREDILAALALEHQAIQSAVAARKASQ